MKFFNHYTVTVIYISEYQLVIVSHVYHKILNGDSNIFFTKLLFNRSQNNYQYFNNTVWFSELSTHAQAYNKSLLLATMGKRTFVSRYQVET